MRKLWVAYLTLMGPLDNMIIGGVKHDLIVKFELNNNFTTLVKFT